MKELVSIERSDSVNIAILTNPSVPNRMIAFQKLIHRQPNCKNVGWLSVSVLNRLLRRLVDECSAMLIRLVKVFFMDLLSQAKVNELHS